jgi:hypothetical protein
MAAIHVRRDYYAGFLSPFAYFPRNGKPQKGLTTTMMTMKIINNVGTSFIIRQ